MRLPLLIILPVLLFGILADVYIYRAVVRRCPYNSHLWRRVALWTSVLFDAGLLLLIAWPKKSGSDAGLSSLMWGLFVYATVYLPKYLFCLVDMLGCIPCLFGRRRLPGFDMAGVVAAVVVFCALWWGVGNTSCLDVRRVDIADASLPEAFDGFSIVQLSDIHCGTFGDNTSFLTKAVGLVNSLSPDIILFTGDIVNRRSDELQPFVSALAGLKAPCGVYSVLGNHDYGDYYVWPSAAAKEANMQALLDMQRSMGWILLNDSTVFLHRGTDSIAVVGVGNVGDPPFPVYGDLDRAYPGDIADGVFKILLSHNPAHWDADICNAPDKNIALTLSGHTHAMQCAIGRFSPAAWKYRTWGGLYADDDSSHRLYVNIGLGEVGIPVRIGATPEITLITLRRDKSPEP